MTTTSEPTINYYQMTLIAMRRLSRPATSIEIAESICRDIGRAVFVGPVLETLKGMWLNGIVKQIDYGGDDERYQKWAISKKEPASLEAASETTMPPTSTEEESPISLAVSRIISPRLRELEANATRYRQIFAEATSISTEIVKRLSLDDAAEALELALKIVMDVQE